MKAYIYGLIMAAVALGVAELLVPENAKTRPYLKLLFGLALLVVIVKPIGALYELLPNICDEIFEAEEAPEYAEMTDEALRSAYRRGVSAALKEKFGLSSFEVGVMLGDDRKPQKIVVTLKGSDIFRNPYSIEEYITAAFGCECTAVVA